ncbi:phospholipid/cholesterol/gamma-HCH transport system substrate-binding protein [Flavobacterium flevense]|uniref:Organic solvent ABC transporter substrate-binding protein n=1 Tax=Flavobacterium flevense TaxID=983 RepID=A0A4Y4AUY6_9FLAO|nr:MlaD family protein [Flavobacterium flevense]GEC72038.1 organic solvent ABC transporter substrate-binding protein [Flavobacterium flevense]SHL93180.1 phospholipid/cholesterol/gamma-HCH transport system substrate-binding protein [Flavobacterium flevense]
MKLTREIKTAILVIASILLFIWGYSFLKGRDLFNTYTKLYVQYDSVEGLAPSAAVTLNGLVIGKVEQISINPNDGKLLVELQIKTDFPISKSSRAVIYEPGFIGGKQILIEPNLADKTVVEQGDQLAGNVKLGMTESLSKKLVPLQDKLEKVLTNIDTLVTGINTVLDQQTQKDLKKTIAELSKTMEQFHQASAGMNSLITDNKAQINGAVSNFNKMSGNFSKISDSLNKADLGKTVKSLNATLAKVNGIMTDLESGNGSMGKLLKDDAFYDNLTKTTKELELLLQDVRLSPTRYINVSLFGKKNKPYKAPVDSTSTK